ncbi:MAG: TIM44-like domain-containing protein [Clostridia bacterium]|nr:TIM44-like domain-containing protein [Clostridia bacterium]
MKKSLLVFFALLFCVLTLPRFSLPARADFGDFAGDDDYGGYDDDDYDYDYDYGGSGSGGSASLTKGDLILIAVIVIVIIIVANKKGKKSDAAVPGPVRDAAAPAALAPMESYRETDPAFSEEALRGWIANAYVRLQRAWELRDLSSVRPLLSDEFCAQTEEQLQAYRAAGRTNRIDRIAVLEVAFLGWRREGERDVIRARVRTRIRDWQVDDKTGAVLAGDPSREKIMEYLWTLGRSAGVTTGTEEPGVQTDSCPNCGAPLDLNRSAVCEYCRSVIRSSRYDWVVTSVQGISQHTV